MPAVLGYKPVNPAFPGNFPGGVANPFDDSVVGIISYTLATVFQAGHQATSFAGTATSRTVTADAVNDSAARVKVTFSGTGLSTTFDSATFEHTLHGNLTGIAVSVNNQPAYSVTFSTPVDAEDFSAAIQTFFDNGFSNNDTVAALLAPFSVGLTGTANVDTITGTDSNEIIEGLGKGDTLNGAGGSDTVSYSGSKVGVTVDLNLQDGKIAQVSPGDAGGDILSSFEHVLGSAKNDRLTGVAANDILGRLDGGAGDDLIFISRLGEMVLGGAGNDTLSFEKSGDGVTADLSLQGTANAAREAITGGGSGTGLIATGVNATEFEHLTGSASEDALSGDAKNNVLKGGGANDTLIGRGGADTLDGGDATDTADYSELGTVEGITVTLLDGKASKVTTAKANAATGDTLIGIEQITGGAGADVLTGNSSINSLLGGDGSDLIQGLGAGDKLDGGDGIDTLSYAKSAAGVKIDLNSASAQTGGDAEGDIVKNFENFTGSAKDDLVVATSLVNQLDGGLGNDTVSYAASSDGVNVDLKRQNALLAKAVAQTGGDADGDKLANFENVTGSAHDDTLIGDSKNNIIDGGADADRLMGGGGSDTLKGGADADAFVYDAKGAVTVADFEDGTDVIELIGGSYSDLAAVLAHTSKTAAGTVIDFGGGNKLTLKDFTGALGKDDFVFNAPVKGTPGPDIFTGNELANIIDGAAGSDLIEGKAGADTLIGGVGNDTLSYLSSSTGVTVSLATQGTASATGVTGGQPGQGGDAAGDNFAGFEHLIGSAQADVLAGDKNANVIEGGDGGDSLNGGLGNDTVSYAGSASAVTVDLAEQGTVLADGSINGPGTKQTGGAALDDLLWGFENVIGSALDDVLTGDGFGNTLAGGAGADTVDYSAATQDITVALGAAGATATVTSKDALAAGDKLIDIEAIVGGSGNDSLTANALGNSLAGGAGNDILKGGAGNDALDGGAGDDTVYASAGTDVLEGGSETLGDTLNFENFGSGVTLDLTAQTVSGKDLDSTFDGFESFIGTKFADVLEGTTGSNLIKGGDGNDLIQGAGGKDVLEGGAGSDTADFSFYGKADKLTVTLGANGAASQTSGSGAVQADTISNIENLIGGVGDDVLTGNAGNNTIEGGAGNDTLTGGGGIDTLSYAGDTAGVMVYLGKPGDTIEMVGGQTINGMEVTSGNEKISFPSSSSSARATLEAASHSARCTAT